MNNINNTNIKTIIDMPEKWGIEVQLKMNIEELC